MSFRPQREIFLSSLAFARHDRHGFVTFAAFAPLREIIPLSVAAVRQRANLFFPAKSGKKRVILGPRKCQADCSKPTVIDSSMATVVRENHHQEARDKRYGGPVMKNGFKMIDSDMHIMEPLDLVG